MFEKILNEGKICLRKNIIYGRYLDENNNVKIGVIGKIYIYYGEFMFEPIKQHLNYILISKVKKVLKDLNKR